MAGDWIKVEKTTPDKPEILQIASMLTVDRDKAFALCFRFWCWCDDHLAKGNAGSVTKLMVDALVDRPGFANAMEKVGWLDFSSGEAIIPNFERHLSKTAKTRAVTAKRVGKHKRESNAEGNAEGNALVTVAALPEKRKEEEEKSIALFDHEDSCFLRETEAALERASILGAKTKPEQKFVLAVATLVVRGKISEHRFISAIEAISRSSNGAMKNPVGYFRKVLQDESAEHDQIDFEGLVKRVRITEKDWAEVFGA